MDWSDIPPGATACIKLIDTTSRIGNILASTFVTPAIDDFEYMSQCPAWSFLIESASGQKVLFDLGVPVKWEEMAPRITEPLKARGWEITVEKEVPEIVGEQGIRTTDINAVIWRWVGHNFASFTVC